MYSAFRTERRKYKRLRVSLAAVYSIEGPEDIKEIFDGSEYEAKTEDIGAGGLSLIVDHYLPLKTVIRVKLVIFEIENSGVANFYQAVNAVGSITSVVEFSDDNYRLGVQFVSISTKCKNNLLDIVNSSLKPDTFVAKN